MEFGEALTDLPDPTLRWASPQLFKLAQHFISSWLAYNDTIEYIMIDKHA